MNDNQRNLRLIANESPEDVEAVRELLEDAGRRPEVSAEDLAIIEAAARSEWEKLVAADRKRFLMRALPLALAASLILAVAVAWWWKQEGPPPAPEIVATVELLKGEAGGLKAGQSLVAGSVAATASPSLAALRFPDGRSVRLDAGTRVRLLSTSRIDLEAGAVYVDSSRPGSFEIGTAFGNVSEIGTQFEIRLEDGDGMRVRVREGEVSLVRGRGSEPVAAGGELRVERDGGVSRRAIDLYGPEWDWVLAAAPSLDIDGSTLGEYLDWVSRETGLKVRYENQTLAGLAETVRLRGSIAGLAPDESLSVILPGSGLGYRIERGTLLITKPPGR